MGCVDSKEKSLDHHPYHHHPHHHPHPHHPHHHPHPHHQPRVRGGVQPQPQPQHYRPRQPPPPQPEVSQSGRPRGARGGPGQDHHGGRRTSASASASSTGSSSASSLDRHVARERDRERRVVTDPRGGRRNQAEEEAGPGLGRRNQFDRASQLRRSKKRKKSRDNSVLEVSQATETSRLSSRQSSPAKTWAKDIAIQETVNTLKSSTSQNPLNVSSEPDNRSEYHTKYGNLI